MKYISDRDYNYIINKYHDTAKPFDTLKRFVRHDEIFDPATGLDGALLRDGVLALDAENTDQPHHVRKAMALRFVLENTRISCDSRDIFPAINAIDRPLTDTIIRTWRAEALEGMIPEMRVRKTLMAMRRSAAPMGRIALRLSISVTALRMALMGRQSR